MDMIVDCESIFSFTDPDEIAMINDINTRTELLELFSDYPEPEPHTILYDIKSKLWCSETTIEEEEDETAHVKPKSYGKYDLEDWMMMDDDFDLDDNDFDAKTVSSPSSPSFDISDDIPDVLDLPIPSIPLPSVPSTPSEPSEPPTPIFNFDHFEPITEQQIVSVVIPDELPSPIPVRVFGTTPRQLPGCMDLSKFAASKDKPYDCFPDLLKTYPLIYGLDKKIHPYYSSRLLHNKDDPQPCDICKSSDSVYNYELTKTGPYDKDTRSFTIYRKEGKVLMLEVCSKCYFRWILKENRDYTLRYSSRTKLASGDLKVSIIDVPNENSALSGKSFETDRELFLERHTHVTMRKNVRSYNIVKPKRQRK